MSTIEKFLHESLSEAELRDVCLAYFPELQEVLAAGEEGVSHEEQATAVWAYIQEQHSEAKFLTALQAHFPQKMAVAFPNGLKPPPPAPEEVVIQWRERLPRPVLIGLGIGLLTTLIFAIIISNLGPQLPPPDPYAPTPPTQEILTASGPILAGQTAVGTWNNTGRANFGFADGPGQFDFVVETEPPINPAIWLFDATNPDEPLFEIDFREDGVEAWRYVNFGDSRAYRLVVVGEPGQEFALTVTRSWPHPIWLAEEAVGVLTDGNPAVYALRDAPERVNVRLTIPATAEMPTTQPLLYMLDEAGQELGYFDQPEPAGVISLTDFALPAGQTVRFVVRDSANSNPGQNGLNFRLLIEDAQ